MKSPKPKIHKDMIVGEVVGMFPEAAEIIMSYGLHCVGCHANAFETLEQGLFGHGYQQDHLDNLLKELNEFAEDKFLGKPKVLPKEAEAMKITMTPVALKKVQAIAMEQDKKNVILRVEVRKVAGALKYSMNFIDPEETRADEKFFPFARGKVKVVVLKSDYKNLDGLKIDYVVEKDREGFKMNNPNAKL
jgi:iron-sulfur cluster assembly accessory protein